MIYVYHHVWRFGPNGEKVYQSQKKRLLENLTIDYTLREFIVDESQNETKTLMKLVRDSHDMDDDDIVLFIHTKGATNTNKSSDDWREYMESELIDNHDKYISKLDTHDISGVLFGLPYWSENFFGGNFWWCKASLLKRVTNDIEDINDRFKAEGLFEGMDFNPWSENFNKRSKEFLYLTELIYKETLWWVRREIT